MSRQVDSIPMKVRALPASSVSHVESVMPMGSSRLLVPHAAMSGSSSARSRTVSSVWIAELLYSHSVPGSSAWSRSIENADLSTAWVAIST